MKAIKVKELNAYLKKIISMDFLLTDIVVEGEISNFKIHENGNIYFSLKDDYSRINAIIFYKDTSNLDFNIENGLKIVVRGSVNYYERDSQITFFISEVISHSSGNLFNDYLKLKEKLESEGLFNPCHKFEIPEFPKTIGIITSSSGAAVRDIVNMIRLRNNLINIIIYPSLVQGPDAPEDLIGGIEYFNSRENIDLIILGRGGGSFEDLFCFNDESLARAIYNSKIPIISAVGHEIDYSISDFVADMRAATPTKAAELATISKSEIENNLHNSLKSLNTNITDTIVKDIDRLKSQAYLLKILSPQSTVKLNRDNILNTFNKLNFLMSNLINKNANFLRISHKTLNLYDFKIEARKESLDFLRKKLMLYYYQKNKFLKNKLDYYLKLINYSINNKLKVEYTRISEANGFFINYKIRDRIEKNHIILKDLGLTLSKIRLSTVFMENINYLTNKKSMLNYLMLSELNSKRNYLSLLNYKLKKIYNDLNKINIYLENGQMLKDIRQLSKGAKVKIFLKNGYAKAEIKEIEEKYYGK